MTSKVSLFRSDGNTNNRTVLSSYEIKLLTVLLGSTVKLEYKPFNTISFGISPVA